MSWILIYKTNNFPCYYIREEKHWCSFQGLIENATVYEDAEKMQEALRKYSTYERPLTFIPVNKQK